MTPDELRVVRRAYAIQVMAADRPVDDPEVEAAFAAVPREDFLGPGPWQVFRIWRNAYVTTPSADPVHLYTNDVVAISPSRRLNNGQPSWHARLLAEARPREGDHVVHVGAGTGYYSALMARLAGAHLPGGGRVTAIEIEPDLAPRARAGLAAYGRVDVVEGDGTTVDFGPADVVYVNAGVTRPADLWLDRLREGGRLILPLAADAGTRAGALTDPARHGAVFLVTRQGSDFRARWISPVAVYPCAGLRDAASEAALAEALARPGRERVARLVRSEAVAAERCWLRAPGWCLAWA